MKRARPKPAAPAPAPVVWRDGVHLVGTPIWCDAARTREACFVSHAGIPSGKHRQIIATDATVKLLGDSLGPRATVLTSPYGRPFSLGATRVELFPSGHCVGAASLSVEIGALRVVYAGAISPRGGGFATPMESRPCEVLVIDASYARPRVRFPAGAEIARDVRAWVAKALSAGGVPILLADPLARAADLIALLAADGPIRVHRSILEITKRLRAAGVTLPAVRRFEGHPAAGEIVIWPIPHARAPAIAGIRGARVAVVDATSRELPWSAHADRDDVLAYVASTGARSVYLTGGATEDLIAALAANGVTARLLGPPRQLALFESSGERGHRAEKET